MYADDPFVSRRMERLIISEDEKDNAIIFKSEERLKEDLPALKEYLKRELKNAVNELERRSRDSILK